MQEILDATEKYCLNTIEKTATEDDENELFRKEYYQGLGELGLGGVTISEEFGGAGLGYQTFCPILETIAKYSVAYAVTLSVSTMVQNIIEKFGSEEQKKTYLPPLTSGQEIGAFALSEAGAGSDAASLQMSAKLTDKGYLLNGSKLWISSGGEAKTYVVMARTGAEGSKGISSFIVEKGTPGFSFGKKEKKMGWRASPTRELVFENCLIPKENLIAKEGQGFKVAMSGLNGGRATIGAIAVGLSKRALDEAGRYAQIRKQFKQSIYDFQGMQFMFADMATEIKASELLVQEAARLIDEKLDDKIVASMAKLKATDTSMSVTTDAVQVLGGVGYTQEYPLERYMRDAKVLQIVEGTNQIQRVVIARNLKDQFQ